MSLGFETPISSRTKSDPSERSVFYPDIYGAEYTDVKPGTHEKYTIKLAPLAGLPILLEARKTHAYGPQHEYFHFDDPLTKKPNENPNVVGWTREGDAEHPGSGLACLISKDVTGTKWMYVGKQHAHEKWQNATGSHTAVVNADVGFD